MGSTTPNLIMNVYALVRNVLKILLNCFFLDLGCCFDPTKSRKCFRPNKDEVDGNSQPNTSKHTPGFAAGITALVCILIYGVSVFLMKTKNMFV